MDTGLVSNNKRCIVALVHHREGNFLLFVCLVGSSRSLDLLFSEVAGLNLGRGIISL